MATIVITLTGPIFHDNILARVNPGADINSVGPWSPFPRTKSQSEARISGGALFSSKNDDLFIVVVLKNRLKLLRSCKKLSLRTR